MISKKRDNALTEEEVILRNTGYETIEAFLDTNKDYVIKDLDVLANNLKEHIKNNELITIVGDYDVDGVTASSIMYLTLKELGANVRVRLPRRLSEGFGLSEKIVDEITEGVILTVDNGIAAINPILKAKEKGLTVYVTDHHLPNEGKIPEADMVIDPHLENAADFENYCGAGIAYKLSNLLIKDKVFNNKMSCLATLGTVCDVMKLNEDNRKIVIDGLDNMCKEDQLTFGLYCLLKKAYKDTKVTMTDIGFTFGPMLNAPGRLEDRGALESLKMLTFDLTKAEVDFLKQIERKIAFRGNFGNTYKSTLVDLLMRPWSPYQIAASRQFASLDKNTVNTLKSQLKSKDVEEVFNNNKSLGLTLDDFKKLNDLLSRPHTPEEILKYEYGYDKLSADEKKEMIKLLNKINVIIKQTEKLNQFNIDRKRIVEDEVMPMAEKIIEENEMQYDLPLVLYIPNQPEGVMGIPAGKLAEKYNTPTFVLTDSDVDGILKGSARTAKDINIKELLDKIPEEFYKYGGHAEAAGLSIRKENFEHARKALQDNCFEPLGYVKDDTLYYDLIIEAKDVSKHFDVLEKLGPFGEGNPPIVYKVKNLEMQPCEEAPDGFKYMGADNKYIKIFCGDISIFCETQKFTDSIADQLLYEISTFAENEEFTTEQKDMISYMISYLTNNFTPKMKSELDVLYTSFNSSDEFKTLVETRFNLISKNEEYKEMYNFDSVNNVLEISKKYDVVGTLSANYFRGKSLQIDALGFEDPERQLIKDKGLEEKTPIEK